MANYDLWVTYQNGISVGHIKFQDPKGIGAIRGTFEIDWTGRGNIYMHLFPIGEDQIAQDGPGASVSWQHPRHQPSGSVQELEDLMHNYVLQLNYNDASVGQLQFQASPADIGSLRAAWSINWAGTGNLAFTLYSTGPVTP